MPPLPDLRFEQSYLASLRGVRGWEGVLWVTCRDQVGGVGLGYFVWGAVGCGALGFGVWGREGGGVGADGRRGKRGGERLGVGSSGLLPDWGERWSGIGLGLMELRTQVC